MTIQTFEKKKHLRRFIETILKIERDYESHCVRQSSLNGKWYIMRREYVTFTPPDWIYVAQLTEKQVAYIEKEGLLSFWS